MGRYFDYNDWSLEEVCNSIRKRISDSKKPIPKKVIRHGVSIIYRTSETSYQSGWNHLHYVDIEDKEQAIKFLDNCRWLIRVDENMWIDEVDKKTYTTKDGITIPFHFEIKEYDYECYEDGNEYVEYSEREKEDLSRILYLIEKARTCLDVYDHCCDQYSFGEDNFSKELENELYKFEENYTEELPQDGDEYNE